MQKKIYIVIYCLLLVIPVGLYVIAGNKNIRKIYVHDYVYDDAKNIVYQIDNICIEDGRFNISGWFIYRYDSQSNNKFNKHIWLKADNGDFLCIKTDANECPEVTSILNDGTDYLNSGFVSYANCDDLNKWGTHFEIYICYANRGVNYIVNTGHVLTIQ